MKPFLRSLRASLAISLFTSLTALACGGNYVPGDDAGSGGGSDTGGAGSDGGTGGNASGTGGNASGGGGGGECCLAEAVCDGFDQQVDSEADCPVGAYCYSRTACCSTIWCMQEQPACDAIPVCEEGELQVPVCPPSASCTERALCGTTITCQRTDLGCDRESELDRHYVAESEAACEEADFTCPEHTEDFLDECGCGCEQSSECPDYVDCAPGQTPDPLCSSEECPYTLRAQ